MGHIKTFDVMALVVFAFAGLSPRHRKKGLICLHASAARHVFHVPQPAIILLNYPHRLALTD
jgi:hypothetical protein